VERRRQEADRVALVLGWAMLGMLCAAGASSRVDPDVFHQMALFREGLRQGWIPSTDVFAYTPTVTPSVQHEWGSGGVLYVLVTSFGGAGLQMLRIVLAGIAAAAIVAVARRRGATPETAFAVAPLGVMLAWIGLTAVRPQLFTLAFLGVLLLALERDRGGKRLSVLGWGAAFIVWANLHAGFVVGGAFVAAHAAEQWWRGRPVGHLIWLLLLVAVGIVVNPYGVAYYPYLWHALRMERPLITEWRPLWEAAPVAVVLAITAIVVAVGAVWSASLRRVPGWPLLALVAWQAIEHERHVSMLALVWLAYVPAALDAGPLGPRIRRIYRRLRWVVTPVLVMVAAVLLARGRPWDLRVPGSELLGGVVYPVGVVEYLDTASFEGNVLTPFVAGAYVSWHLYPRVRVSIDGRYEVAYPPSLLRAHAEFFSAEPGWEEFLDRFPTDMVLAYARRPVVDRLEAERAWVRVYEDDAYTLLARPGLLLPQADRRGEAIFGQIP
jgi:hypothetical protein